MFGGDQASAFVPAGMAGGVDFLGGIVLAAGSPTRPIALTLAMDMAAIPTAVPFG